MKMNIMVSSLAFALAITLASTGCAHKPVNVTHIPGPTPPPVADNQNINTIPYNQQNEPPIGNQNQIATATDWDPANMTLDRAALAADTIHFAYDSAVIRDSEQSDLQAVAQALASDMNVKLLIEGNCDERGTEEYNRSLGERRALAAREALSKLGVDPMRVRTISYGKDKPADPGHDGAAWSKNRRDDFVLCHPKSGA
ncbi:MAG TPA: OmpA family protein [Verrucomicrobiae bacterium]|jgi:peptidoglycan-associated lipoprotein